MSPLLGRGSKKRQREMQIEPIPFFEGWRFTLKGSPRHYDDVKRLIEADGDASIYFGEALAYERGAGIALWRVRAQRFDWLPKLYAWWAEMERIEPIQFTFHLYLPAELSYSALDLRDHQPRQVAEFIEQHAPWDGGPADTASPARLRSGDPAGPTGQGH